MISKLQNHIDTYGLDSLKNLAYHFSKKHEYSCILDSCQLNTGVHGGEFEFLGAFGAKKLICTYAEFKNHTTTNKDWMFGILGYDLKNNFEKAESNNNEIIATDEVFFFIPQIVIGIDKNEKIVVLKGDIPNNFWDTSSISKKIKTTSHTSPVSKSKYLDKIAEIHELIKAGDVYELNYCVPHTTEYDTFDPIQFHIDLLKKSPVPMASYLKAKHIHLCGASMERFLMKKGNTLISQPIKGTIKKGSTSTEDLKLIHQLENSEKDRAENVMIVDLVRNDLNRVCETGTVKVKELFGIYSYLQVHQMISTIEGKVNNDITIDTILRATFPMGSMTGAPKIATMQHIERLEDFKRGWYSGALGYISPTNDFDFNVVIRTVLCDTKKKLLNYNAGGAITIDSIAEEEWKEVQLKTKAITEVLAN